MENLKVDLQAVEALVREEFERGKEAALSEPNHNIRPSLLVITGNLTTGKDWKYILCAFDYGFYEKRFDLFKALGRRFGEDETAVVAIIHLNEVWMVNRPLADPNFNLLPSDDPARAEAIIAMARTVDGHRYWLSAQYTRGADGFPIFAPEEFHHTEPWDKTMTDGLLECFFYAYSRVVLRGTRRNN